MNRRQLAIGIASGLISSLKFCNRVIAERRNNEISVASFFDKLGPTDVAIQMAIDVAVKTGCSTVHLPSLGRGRQYLIKKTIRNDGVAIVGDGPSTILQKIGPGSCFISGQVPPKATTFLQAALRAGTDKICLSILPNFQLNADGVYVLTSEAYCHGNTPAHRGDFMVVKKIVDGVAILDQPLRYDYLLADGASIRRVTLSENVEYRDLSINMDKTVIPPGAMTRFDNYGIQLDFCWAPIITNITICSGVAAGIRLLGCIDARVSKYTATDLGSAEEDNRGTSSIGLGGYGYGIAERGLNRGLVVEGAVTDRVRHLYTSAAEWVDTFKYGMPTSSQINNSISRNAKGACFDTHETGINITFHNCHADGGQAVGFQIRSKQARLLSCTARNVGGSAVWIYGANVHRNAAGDYCYVEDFRCDYTNYAGPSVHNENVPWTEMGAVLDQGFGNRLNHVLIEHSGGPALMIAKEARGGSYQSFSVSDACENTTAEPYIVVVEQDSVDAAPKMTGFYVTKSPRVRGIVKVTNPICHPVFNDGHIE